MAAFGADTPPTNLRAFNLGAAPVASWTATQLDFRVRRPLPALKHVRDMQTSLLQSAFDEVVAERQQELTSADRSRASVELGRPALRDPLFNAVTDYLIEPTEVIGPESAERGFVDTAKYCASLAKGMAGQMWNAYVKGNRTEYDAYKAALTAKFGDCDPNFKDALVKYAEFVVKRGKIPYRPYKDLGDAVIENKLPANAKIGIVADWGTGQPEALEVLRQVKKQNPQVVIHLGDIYYAGTANEVQNYFYRPWKDILQTDSSGIVSLALPGNHDLYAGGQPFYELLDKLGQAASYFCLRNKDWQLIGLDTALNDKLSGPPTSLDPSEVVWLKDKIDTAGSRRTMLLSHHQLYSTNEKFDNKSFNENLYKQVKDILPKVDLWLWGHEHDLVIFGDHMGLKRGRCVGGSAFPVGKYELPAVAQNPDVPFNKQVMLSKGAAFYQHCYAMVQLDGPKATVSYCEDSDGGRTLFSETIG
jgi:predicted phosphodiesterase